jgi:ubiquinone/menaquinone biosynthesis C-methylase UbiE
MNTDIFRCPVCGQQLPGWPPEPCAACHYPVRTSENIYIFSREQNLKLDAGEQYIGFDRMAEHYDKTRHLVPGLEKIASNHIAGMAGPIGNLVDLGSGTGVFSIALSRHAKRIVAADISTEMLKLTAEKIAREHIANVVPCRINVYRLPIASRSMDVVLAVNIFNLLGRPEVAVKEIKRVLRESGALVTIQFNVTENPRQDINDEIESEYYKELLSRDIETLKPPGWLSPQLDTELQGYFNKREIVKAKDLQFKIVLTPEYEYQNLMTRQYPTQLLLDQSIHFEVMDVTDNRMKSKYGSSYRETQLEYKLEVELGFYRNV